MLEPSFIECNDTYFSLLMLSLNMLVIILCDFDLINLQIISVSDFFQI